MRRLFLFVLLSVLLLAGTPPTLAQTPTIEQWLNMKAADNPRLSPDGRFVVYTLRETDWKENAFVNQLWIVNTLTGERYQLTRHKRSSVSPEWSPDSKRIAFLSPRDNKSDLYLISPTGGEAEKVATVESGVEGFHWSPDGRSIAFTATDPETKAQKERKEKYGDFEVVAGEYSMTHLWVVEVPTEGQSKPPEARRLTEGDKFTVSDFSWSPDSQRIAFSASKNPDLNDIDSADLYVVNVKDKAVKKLVETKGPESNPMWSPDGKEIAFETANGQEFFFFTNTYLAVVPAGGGKPRLLTEAFDEQPNLLAWSPDGIYFSAQQKTYAHLFRLNPTTKAIERVSGPSETISFNFTFDRSFSRTAFLTANAKSTFEIGISSVKTFRPILLTEMTKQFASYKLATREVIGWKSVDGTPIEGILYKPADFDKNKKYPLLVVIHGGPTGVDMAYIGGGYVYPIEQFVAKGALALKVNYRGSAGYGEKFRALNVRNLGLGDYEDVISGVDFLIGQGCVDRNRVGAMGWSQGGYISAFIATYSDRFKAVSVGAGISNWVTYYVNTDIHPFTRQYLKATPWDDPEVYRKTSPISYIKNAKTPTLIQHCDNDRRVPIPNAYELYQGLQDRGVPSKLIVYKGFGHGISKPRQQQAATEHNYEWFAQWIWGEKPKGK